MKTAVLILGTIIFLGIMDAAGIISVPVIHNLAALVAKILAG